MPLNRKGQVSFEILLLTAIVFALAIWVNGYYLSIKDSTLALQLTKIHALKQIENSDSFYIIEKIDFEETASDAITLKIDILGTPEFTCDDLQHDELKIIIAENTKYSPQDNVTIELNETPC